uniref:Uncharacterized protein n=1 Tax=Octopus bimaculoides TaxID=37653 RepID=A0A0L8I7M5_OCTBM
MIIRLHSYILLLFSYISKIRTTTMTRMSSYSIYLHTIRIFFTLLYVFFNMILISFPTMNFARDIRILFSESTQLFYFVDFTEVISADKAKLPIVLMKIYSI